MSKSHSVEACCQLDGWEGKAEYVKLLESATLPRTLAVLPDAVFESFNESKKSLKSLWKEDRGWKDQKLFVSLEHLKSNF